MDGPRAVRVDLRQPLELDPRHGRELTRDSCKRRDSIQSPPHMAAVAAPGGAGAAAPVPHGAARVPRDAADRACGALHRRARRRAARARDLPQLHRRDGGLADRAWVGLGELPRGVHDPIFRGALWHTFLFTVISQAIVDRLRRPARARTRAQVPRPLVPALPRSCCRGPRRSR